MNDIFTEAIQLYDAAKKGNALPTPSSNMPASKKKENATLIDLLGDDAGPSQPVHQSTSQPSTFSYITHLHRGLTVLIVDLLGDLSGLSEQNTPQANQFLMQPAGIQLGSGMFLDIFSSHLAC